MASSSSSTSSPLAPLLRGGSFKETGTKLSTLVRWQSLPAQTSFAKEGLPKGVIPADSSSKRWTSVAASMIRWVGLLLIGVYLCIAITYAKHIRYPNRMPSTAETGNFHVGVGEADSGLVETFYAYSCPQAVSIVSQLVDEFVTSDPTLAGGLLRLHFHDCFLTGCDGSVLLNSTALAVAEKDASANAASLRGFQQIDEIKSALEEVCPEVVSCADILALVAREATVKAGGPSWLVPLGRRDGFESLESEADARLPFPHSC